MSSFYGGKQGFSFMIVKNFQSVAEMNAAFADGDSYTEVRYGEYVLINSDNKNHVENGQIYRRDISQAIYIGSIAGPDGAAPQLELTSLADVQAKKNEPNSRYKEGSYTVQTGDLVPGDTNSTITWASCSVRDDNGEDTAAFIGFKIPYHVMSVIGHEVDAYTEASVTRKDNGSRPFYSQWDVAIPKGIKGDALDSIYVDDDYNLYYILKTYDTLSSGTAQAPVKLGTINSISDMVIRTDNYHLLVYYSDPNQQGTVSYNGKYGWKDIGSIKDDSGILVGLNKDYSVNSSNKTYVINQLNAAYPNGLTGTNLQGKVVSVGTSNDNKDFYAFDYDLNTWYFLGEIGKASSNSIVMIGSATDTDIESKKTNLSSGGIWFIVEE